MSERGVYAEDAASGCWLPAEPEDLASAPARRAAARAARRAWRLARGPIPAGMSVVHSCGELRCVNPEHLALAAPSEVAARRPGAKLSVDQVVEIRRLSEAGMSRRAVAERFREKIEDMRVEHGGQVVMITISIGVASLTCCEDWNAEELIGVADRRLYAAKRGGRNQVVASG